MGKKNAISVVLLGIVLAVIPVYLGNPYYISVLSYVGIYCLITIGLSLLMGFAGQISLGHAAFYGIGAYTSGILISNYGMGVWPSFAVAILVSGILALIVGIPTLRLTGHYLAMATLAFGIIVYIFFEAAVGITGGPSGLPVVSDFGIGNWMIDSEIEFYYLIWFFAFITLVLSLNIVHSRIGRALLSIHSSETAAKAMGVNTSRIKIQIFVLSACLTSLAGCFYSQKIMFISPSAFGFKFSVTLVTMVAVGGMTSLWGAIAGTILLAILPECLSGFEDYYLLIYGGIMIIIMMFLPQGFLVALVQGIGKLFRKIEV